MAVRSKRTSPTPSPSQKGEAYEKIRSINGTHDFRDAVPNGFVNYEARLRKGGKVSFFNFTLAKEMGLLPESHPEKMNPSLHKALLETFGLQIINEWDIKHQVQVPDKEKKPHPYMATRYLQLQHKDKTGKTSGDGRSIWNGQFKGRGRTWDISSCGTGATRLSPAAGNEGRFFKTGDTNVAYGNGYADIVDGLGAAIMSEILHRTGIETERTLVLVEYEKNFSVNVRAAKSLLRPSHFFMHLKQNNYEMLKSSIDYFMERMIENKDWPPCPDNGKQKYQYFLERMALTFSQISARYEIDYLFVWMDWDGDNILANGGIIDYGSVRQFGLYHAGYRYDDGPRFSTNLAEQKGKARYTVQVFAQLCDYLTTGKKRRITAFKNDPALKLFDQHYQHTYHLLLLEKAGLSKKTGEKLLASHLPLVREFKKHYQYFERVQSSRGVHATNDGVTSDAVFCMRDLMREIPRAFHKAENQTHSAARPFLEPQDFIEIAASSYAKKNDLHLRPHRVQKIRHFQESYSALLNAVSEIEEKSRSKVLLETMMRSSLINRPDRITGDGIIEVTYDLRKIKKKLPYDEYQALIKEFIENHTIQTKSKSIRKKVSSRLKRFLNRLSATIMELRETF